MLKSILEDPGPDRPPGEDIPNWCKCGKCREMDRPVENVCCGYFSCFTTFDHFHFLCLNPTVLTVSILQRADIRADAIDYSPASFRKASYRQYILWKHGHLGAGNRRVVPSCVVWAVRDCFPSPNGQYMGFREY